jgi:hypothetical protein
MAPHCKEGQVPKPTTFVPTIPPPKHHSQDYAELVRLQAALNGNG